MARRRGSKLRRGRRRRLGVTTVSYRRRNPALSAYARTATRAIVGRKRRATGRTITVGKRKRPNPRAGGGSRVEYRYHKFGKYGKYTVGLLKKLVVNRIQLRLQAMLRSGSVVGPNCPGFHPLISDLRDAGPGVDSFAPVHVYSLMTCNNSSSTVTTIPCSWRLKFTSTGAPNFEPLAQMDPNSAVSTANGFYFEGADYNTQQHHHKYIRHQWIDIRLNLHGRTHESTTFDVMIFRIDPKYFWIDPIDGGNGLVGEDIQRRNGFWQGIAKTLIVNPIMPGGAEALKGMRMVKKYRYVVQPTQSTDNNDEPENRVVKIFVKMPARAHDYDLAGAGGHGAESTLFSTNYIQENLSTTFSDVPARPYRMFMMIRANNSTWRSGEAFPDDEDPVTRANTPSYDIMIRKKIECKR